VEPDAGYVKTKLLSGGAPWLAVKSADAGKQDTKKGIKKGYAPTPF